MFDVKYGKTCVGDSIMIGLCFPSDWLRELGKLFKPVTKHSYAKPKQM